MKIGKAAVLLLLTLFPWCSRAQKHFVYTDADISLAYFDPGFSATYNYKIAKHIGLGIGAQAYVFHPAVTNPRQFTPAVFADWRFLIRPKHISQYFVIWDLGWDFYKHNNDFTRDGNYVYKVPNDNGTYIGLAVGYFHRLSYRGWGPYTTLKLINNFYRKDQINILTGEHKSLSSGGGTLVVSVGFRFGDETKRARKVK